jgi:lipopolysaccharide biosynthesis glycosyltransferase
MEPVVVALSSNERYFPGLYCAVASALSYLNPARKVDLRVLDDGISQASRDALSGLISKLGRPARLEFVTVDASLFAKATLGPGKSHMTYCRILLPELLDVPRLIYVDSDLLVFRDLSELFDLPLSRGKVLAAVPDSETPTLGDDSRTLADARNLPHAGCYFNAGVMLLDLDELRTRNFTNQSVEFFNEWHGCYRFHDQSAFNFLLHREIEELPEHWNRASCQFDAQNNNDLNCVLHYTGSVPWLGGTPGPAQVLFERFALNAGLPVNQQTADFRKSRRQRLFRSALAPVRAVGFRLLALFYKVAGRKQKWAAYEKAARYWSDYIRKAPDRWRVYHRRRQEIDRMKFREAVSTTRA